MIDGYTYILPYKHWGNLVFCRGGGLADPKGLLKGTGAKMRHVKIRSIDEASQLAFRTLIKGAFEHRIVSER